MKKTLLLLLVLGVALTASAREKKQKGPKPLPVFLYAVSTSFNDSITYITDIQKVDSGYMERRHILGGMREYVGQMDAYYKAKGQRRLNTVFFKTNRKKAEKGFIKLKKKLVKNGANLKVLPQGEFTFKSEKRPAAE